MSSSAIRGAILVALAVLLGFLILRGVTDRTEIPLTTTGTVATAPTPTPTPSVDAGSTAPLPTPTAVIDTSNARPNAQISVMVANGTEVSGQAGRLTDILRNQGFTTQAARNANAQPASVIYYRPSFNVEAQVVRDALGTLTPIAPMPVPDPNVGDDIDLGNVDVFVLIGDDALARS